MEHDGALQGVPGVRTLCGEDGQPIDIHPHHPQLGCYWALMGRHVGFI